MLFTQDHHHGTRCAIGLFMYIELATSNWLNKTSDEIIWEKTRIKGITELKYHSNGLGITAFHDLYSYMGFSRCAWGYLRRSSRKGLGLDRQVVNVLDWDINDVFNDSTTQEVNWHRHMTRVDLVIGLLLQHEFESGTAANKVTRSKEIEVWYQQYNRRNLTVMMSNAHGGSICAHE